jgi:Chromo (CHRromatin Organisation MOdifier) domain
VVEEMLRHYIAPTLNDWDTHLCLAEFAINNSWQSSIQTTPFFAYSGQHPLTPASIDVDTKIPAARLFVENLTENLNRAKMCMRKAQDRHAHYANKKRKHIEFPIGSQVKISTKNFHYKTQVPSKKLLPKWMGPYDVIAQVNPVTYRLKLPDNFKIHDVFHVSLLQPYRWDGVTVPPPPHVLEDGTFLYDVDTILGHRENKKGVATSYLVRWLGYHAAETDWEPPSSFVDCPQLLTDYWKNPTLLR